MKKFISFILCLCIILICSITTAANTAPVITISNVTADNGQEVVVDISIAQNPGIMAMAFCITYDSSALEYTGYNKGYLSKYTIKDHSAKGHISFVNDESSDKATNGVIVSVKFKIKDNARGKKYEISLANLNRQKYGTRLYKSFSNSKLESIEPTVISGGITVRETCENSDHKFSDWSIITPADCTNKGSKTHTCIRCEFSETAEIPITHNFEAEWTIDKAATPEEDGEMSRHCTLCDAVTDKITFSYEEIGGDDDTSSESPSDDISGDTSKNENPSYNENDSNDEITSSDTINNNENVKPDIDNVVGEKVPQQEAEKLENYQPPKENDDSSEITSSEDDASEIVESDNELIDSITTDTNQPNANSDGEKTSFFDTPLNVALVVIGIVLLVGIIIFSAVIIIKRKK